MKNKIITIFLILTMLVSGLAAYSAETGAVMMSESFDSGFGSLTKGGDATVGKNKSDTVAILNSTGDLTYTPKASDTGWDDSLRTTYRMKMSDWNASGDIMLLFRIKSQGGSQTYISYYTKNGFSLQRLYPSGAGVNLSGYTGAVSADSSQWHDITTECITNSDGTNIIRVYFDGEKKLEVHDTDTNAIPSNGGFMVRNYLKTPVYIDSIVTESVVVKNETYAPDAPAPDTIGTDYEEDSAALRLLGIMDNFEENMFRGDYIMTRSEFVQCVISLLGYEEVVKNTTQTCSFTDVSGELAGCIAIAEALGIVNGYNSQIFGPDNVMTFNEAAKMLVCALGYNIGDIKYPSGYIAKASEIGLLQGIGSYDTSRGTMARLLINALDIPVNRIYEYGGGGAYKIKKGETVLEQRGIITGKGVVTDNGITNYTSASTLPDDNICINHEQMRVGITSAKDYFGYDVEYYAVEKDGLYELIYVRPSVRNLVYTVSSENIDGKTTLDTFYYFEGDKTKKLSISKICNYIVNGIAKPGAQPVDLKPADGYVTLIDADSDDVIDTMLITRFITVVADYFAASSKTVYNKIPGGTNLVLDDEEKTVEIYKNDEKTEFGGLKAGDVIKAAVSEGEEYVFAIASAEKISGVLTGIDAEFLTIGNQKFELSANLVNPVLTLGAVYSASLDYEGKIAYIDFDSGKSEIYGYMRNAGPVDGMEESFEVEIFTSVGEWVIFRLAEKIRFNNTPVNDDVFISDSSISSGGVIIPQLIAYRANEDNVISVIKTGIDNPASDELMDKTELTKCQYKLPNKSFNSTYFLHNTIIFSVPETEKANDDLYRVTNYSYLTTDRVYANATLYNTEENCPEAVVIEENITYSSSPAGACSVIAISDIVNTLNSDGDSAILIKGYYNNAYIEYYVAPGLDVSSLARGDGIQFTLNAKGEIINFKHCSNADSLAYGDIGGFDSSPRYITGKVCKIYPSAKRFVVNIDGTDTVSSASIWAECSSTTPKCYMYDSETKKTSLATFDDIETGCEIFLRMEREWLYDIIIYK